MKMPKIKKIFITILFILINVKVFADTCAWDLLRNETWVLAEYYDILKSQNRNTLIKIFPKVEGQYYFVDEHNYEPYEKTWADMYEKKFEIIFSYPDEFVGNNDYSQDTKMLYIGDGPYIQFVISDIIFNKSNVQLYIQSPNKYAGRSFDFIINYPVFNKTSKYNFNIYFDGDYFDLYINNKLVHKFCRIDENSLAQYQNLIKDNTCDLSKVTWPRHADGTCDYDDKIIIPDSVKIVEELKKEFSVKKNAVKVIEKPILQKGEYTVLNESDIREESKVKSTLIAKIGSGSKVIVKKIGRKETINGITSNWVKINIVPGAENGRGYKLPEYIKGWLFGGNLEDK